MKYIIKSYRVMNNKMIKHDIIREDKVLNFIYSVPDKEYINNAVSMCKYFCKSVYKPIYKDERIGIQWEDNSDVLQEVKSIISTNESVKKTTKKKSSK